MQSFPDPAFVDANGTRLAVYEVDGDPDRTRPPVLFVHGWPEIAYSWKNQLSAIADAGFRAIAFDLKGFGYSDTPADPALYDIAHLTDDVAALLDGLGVEKVILCGHDWGGAIVWPMAQRHPDRVAGVIGVCTPHRPPPPVAPLTIIKKRLGDQHYFIQFQEDGVCEDLFATDVERFFKIMFRKPHDFAKSDAIDPRIYDLPGRFKNGPAPVEADVIIDSEDLNVFIKAYEKSGFRGGVNLYRNIDRNWEIMKNADPIINLPSLWIGAMKDFFLPPDGADGMEKLVPNLEKHLIDDCGHWVMWEKPDALNALIIDWLLRKFSG